MAPSSALLEHAWNVFHAKPRSFQNEPQTQHIAMGIICLDSIHVLLSSQCSVVSRNNHWKYHLLVLSLIPKKDIIIPNNVSTLFQHRLKKAMLTVQDSKNHWVQKQSSSRNSVGLHLWFLFTPLFKEDLVVEKWLALDLKGGRFCGASGREMSRFLISTAQGLKSKMGENRHGSHLSCVSYKLDHVRRIAMALITLFTLQQKEENNNCFLGSLHRLSLGRTPSASYLQEVLAKASPFHPIIFF